MFLASFIPKPFTIWFFSIQISKSKTLCRENMTSFVSYFVITFSHKNTAGEGCFKKRGVSLQNLIFQKCYFHIRFILWFKTFSVTFLVHIHFLKYYISELKSSSLNLSSKARIHCNTVFWSVRMMVHGEKKPHAKISSK